MPHLATLPLFLTWFPLALALLGAFGAAYVWATPWREVALVRDGNVAAALSLTGATLGFSLVLAAILVSAANRADFVVWALIGAAAQVAAPWAVRALFGPGLRAAMERGHAAAGLLVGGAGVAVGVVNAATMLT